MDNNKMWYALPKGDKTFLIALILYVFVFFLPWSHEITILDISLFAWAGMLLFFIAPIVGLFLILIERPEENKKGEESNVN